MSDKPTLARKTNGVVSVGVNASLMFSRGLPRKVATNVAATFRPKGPRLSLSPVLEVCCQESTRTRWGGRPAQLAGGTRSGGTTRVGDPPWRSPLAEPTPAGASSPASLLRCLPVTPLCVLPRRDMTSRSIKGERRAAGPVRLPSLISSRGEAPPPRDPMPAASRENDLHRAGERSIPRSVESPSHRQSRNQPTLAKGG